MFWLGGRKRQFSVASFYNVPGGGGGVLFSWKSVWCNEPPSKVSFFAWTVALDWVLRIDNLLRRC